MKNLLLTISATLLGCLLLCEAVASRYADRPAVVKRDTESVPYDFIDEAEALEEEDPQFGDLGIPEKRHLCRKYFIYNPVKGRCMPTLMMFREGCIGGDCATNDSPVSSESNPVVRRLYSDQALRTMRTKSLRSFPNPQAWAHFG